MQRLLITGAGGTVGTILRDGLRGLAAQTRLLDIRPVGAGLNEEYIEGDVANVELARRAIAGCDACVHLAGIPVEAPFDEMLRANIQGTWSIFEAARLENCERVVFASSNHTTGFIPSPSASDRKIPCGPTPITA